jgi:hypothetical protein
VSAKITCGDLFYGNAPPNTGFATNSGRRLAIGHDGIDFVDARGAIFTGVKKLKICDRYLRARVGS